jgi:hypothetical protein
MDPGGTNTDFIEDYGEQPAPLTEQGVCNISFPWTMKV